MTDPSDSEALCPQPGMPSSDHPCGLSSTLLSPGQQPRTAGRRRRPCGGPDLTGRAEKSVRRPGPTDGPPPVTQTAPGRPPITPAERPGTDRPPKHAAADADSSDSVASNPGPSAPSTASRAPSGGLPIQLHPVRLPDLVQCRPHTRGGDSDQERRRSRRRRPHATTGPAIHSGWH
jgi:hypothetical protein